MVSRILNTIAKGFAGGGETNSTRNKYAPSVIHVCQKIVTEPEEAPTNVNFFVIDADKIYAHENDPMVIKI